MAMETIAIAASIDLYSKHVPRCSNRGSFLADAVSKDKIWEAAFEVNGPTAISQGWKFPRLPRAFHDWVRHPSVHQSLGEDIIDELELDPRSWEVLNFRSMAEDINL